MYTYAVIEQVKYTTNKYTHAGSEECIDSEYNYQLKFSWCRSKKYMKEFKDWIKERKWSYSWDDEMSVNVDTTKPAEDMHCICESMSNYLADNWFWNTWIWNIIHHFQRNEVLMWFVDLFYANQDFIETTCKRLWLKTIEKYEQK